MATIGPYLRISDDDEQLGLGVARQLKDIGFLLASRGHQGSPPYSDNNVSAYQRGVVRDEFERLLGDFKAGVIDGIATYDLDRLARKPTDLERIIDAYDEAVKRGRSVFFLTVQGNLDLSSPDGRTMARVLISFANKSSMDTARRVARKRLEHAMSGGTWSTYRPFGWLEDRVTLNEPEAEIIRQAVRDVINGIGLYVICQRLNKQGILTVRGNKWKTSAMRRILNSPRLAGFAVYRGEVLLEDGQPIQGKWQPVLTEDEWRALVATLQDNKQLQVKRSHRYLLTAIARCGLCGAGMVGGTPKQGPRRYLCRSPDSGGCAKVGIVMDKLDHQIETLVLAYLKDHTVETEEVWTGQVRLSEVTQKIAELMTAYREGMSGGLVFPEIRKLEDEQRQLQAERGKFTRTQKQTTTITGEWPDLSYEEKRAIIQSVIEAIIIKPAGRTGVYNPQRVEIAWKQ